MKDMLTRKRPHEAVTLKRTKDTDELDMRSQHTHIANIVLGRINGGY